MAHSFTEDSQLLTELRALFDAIDTDNSGTISHAEMLEVVLARPAPPPPPPGPPYAVATLYKCSDFCADTCIAYHRSVFHIQQLVQHGYMRRLPIALTERFALYKSVLLKWGRCPELQAMKTGQWNLSDSEVSQLLAQLEVTPQGAFDYGDWIAALVDWKSLQVAPSPDAHAHAQPERRPIARGTFLKFVRLTCSGVVTSQRGDFNNVRTAGLLGCNLQPGNSMASHAGAAVIVLP